ncbi:hypothetical protein P8452_66568 [Trifolium repens]|nr:hypothetical protein P8452_66568 [Trifolium repens]
MHAFSIPWGCLDGSKEQVPQPQKQSKTTKTFAQALSNVCDIPTSQLPQPCVKGDGLAIAIPEEEYMAGIDACKHNLHGRVVWPKGSTPLTIVALKNKLLPLWKDLSRSGITSLGKGFYEFCFSFLEDVKRVRSVASWNLQPGFLKLFAWTSDFNPNLQRNTTAQVWVRLFGLAQEYWRPKILFAIASSVGTPICTDALAAKPMFDRTFGHFARVLVDMDLSQPLRYKVLVERVGFAFYVDLEYENLPPFCSHCMMVGHFLENCKWNQNFDDGSKEKNSVKNKNEATLKYVQKKDGRSEKNKSKEVINVEDSVDTNAHSLSAPKDNLMPEAVVAPMQVPAGNSVADNVENLENNRFSALVDNVDDDNVVEPIEVVPVLNEVQIDDVAGSENLIENPVDGEVNDSSSEDSEFVDATQVVHGEVGSDFEVDKTQQDMQFLKESWANIAEKEDEELRLLAELEKDPASSGFKVVASKSSKKEKAKLTRNLKTASSYGTRSKVSVTKPFK